MDTEPRAGPGKDPDEDARPDHGGGPGGGRGRGDEREAADGEPGRREGPRGRGRQIALVDAKGADQALVPDDAQKKARQRRQQQRRRQQQIDLEKRKDIQRQIVRQRRRKARRMLARLAAFVVAPTLAVALYYYLVAVDLYESDATFIVLDAGDVGSGLPGAGGGLLGKLGIGGGGAPTESIAVQDFVLSREVMRRLNEDLGLIAHFQDPAIDWLQRLPEDATEEAAFDYYQRRVDVGYDPLEGLLRMSVRAASPQMAHAIATAIVGYSEQMVDGLSDRIRRDQVASAERELKSTEQRVRAAQDRVTELRLKRETFGVETELAIEVAVIQNLENRVSDLRARLANLQAVVSNPDDRRVVNLGNEIAALEDQIAARRSNLSASDSENSLARINAEFERANLDLELSSQLFAAAVGTLEAARSDALKQFKYLEVTVPPSMPDEATHPERGKNVALAFLIIFGAYVLISLSFSILREQASL